MTATNAGTFPAPQVPPQQPLRRRKRASGATVARYAVLILMVLLLAGPLIWQLSLSLKGAGDALYERPPQLIPQDPTLENYSSVLDRIPVLRFVFNSAIVAAIVVGGNVLFATAAGFALARLQFRFRGAAMALFVAALLVPVEAIIIAQFLLVRSAGLTDSLLGVALPTLVAPLNVLLMRNVFLGIPDELEEAAVIDGANVWQRFLRICLPQVKGVVTVVAIFAFVGSWNDFLWPLIVLSSESNYTLTVGLNYLRGTFYDDPRLIAAGTIIALVPIIVFFAALQRYFVRGLEQGGIKG
ncbi:carbohydrate ABC transporter permease [Bogoriella caseilytica]|uniref:Multiple sugar transport system permease protein n=1 Tax=Bogoriella caseilytica TaxID=56055 RepID=A0A3N2BCT6_9MICO|nr:carbohydrate ABC transporter permease [Bogoriella caseilytica]ROR73048.1 multiple sugar transport system permease protein [Bogoriella caseilytica]